MADELPDRDRRASSASCLFEAERRSAPQVSLETLIHRAISETGYDHHVLSLPAGVRRMANVRKLMRMAREYEAEEGRDLRAFIDTLAERDAALPREGEAPLEAEALDAVRLMTVHRAKGLEFPWCGGRPGQGRPRDYGALRISEDAARPAPGLDRRRAVDSAKLERIRPSRSGWRGGEKRSSRGGHPRSAALGLSRATDLEGLPPPRT